MSKLEQQKIQVQRQQRMIKENSKSSLKICNVKIVTPLTNMKTPIAKSAALTERMMNIASPSTSRKQLSTQRKVISIDLKYEKKQTNNSENTVSQTIQNKLKKVLKIRRKTQSVQKMQTNSEPRPLPQSTQKRITKAQSTSTLNPKLKCFDETNFTSPAEPLSSRSRQNNWEEIVELKKQQLYSQIYKMDKKLFSLQRDLEDMADLPDKKTILDMIRKKTGGKANTGVNPIQIHTNIYKMGKNRVS